MSKLRWCIKDLGDGKRSEPVLQYFSEYYEVWEDVEFVVENNHKERSQNEKSN